MTEHPTAGSYLPSDQWHVLKAAEQSEREHFMRLAQMLACHHGAEALP